MRLEVVLALAFSVMTFSFINIFFDVRFFEGMRTFLIRLFDDILDGIGNYNTRKFIDRRKREAIIKNKENVISRYNNLVESFIIDFNWPLTLESFNSSLCVAFMIVVLIVLIFMKNITLSVFVAMAMFIGLLTIFVMRSKSLKSEKLESIMDAEDLICPLAHKGVLVAIKKVMETDEYIHESIRPFFAQFIHNCENNGYSFRQAIEILNKQLGHKFDDFTKKAIIFEYNERKGMADIFLDIVDENAILRQINTKKDKTFHKMNRDFFFKTLIIVLFFMFAITIPEFSDFMIDTTLGKTINTILVCIVCLSFARCQSLQGDLEIR